MNGRTRFTIISLICVVVISAYLWHSTSHVHKPAEEKPQPLLKELSYPAEKVKRIQSLSKAQFYNADVENMSSLPESQPYTADEVTMDGDEDRKEEMLPSVPETLPYTRALKRIDEIQKALWITHLYQFLQSLNKSISPQVNMVFGDSDHMELVLNWIIAAHVRLDPPLHNIMVLSVDQPLCDFLASKTLPVTCIAVPPESLLNSPSRDKSYGRGIKCRFVVLRIINYWGYDVASYDSDAVLLRNPQFLYDSNPDVKLFAGSGTYPNPISDQWGFSLCAGVLLLRSHNSTGTYDVHVCMHVVKSSEYTSHTFFPYVYHCKHTH